MGIGVASMTLLFQMLDLSRSIAIRWRYQWFFADGVSHLLFLIVLCAMMYLWQPASNSDRYAYSVHVDPEQGPGSPKGVDNAATPWAEEDGEEEEGEDDSFWSMTHAGPTAKAVAPSTIGV